MSDERLRLNRSFIYVATVQPPRSIKRAGRVSLGRDEVPPFPKVPRHSNSVSTVSSSRHGRVIHVVLEPP